MMDTCEMCEAVTDCRISGVWHSARSARASATGWTLVIYPDSPAERVDYVMTKMAQEVSI